MELNHHAAIQKIRLRLLKEAASKIIKADYHSNQSIKFLTHSDLRVGQLKPRASKEDKKPKSLKKSQAAGIAQPSKIPNLNGFPNLNPPFWVDLTPPGQFGVGGKISLMNDASNHLHPHNIHSRSTPKRQFTPDSPSRLTICCDG